MEKIFLAQTEIGQLILVTPIFPLWIFRLCQLEFLCQGFGYATVVLIYFIQLAHGITDKILIQKIGKICLMAFLLSMGECLLKHISCLPYPVLAYITNTNFIAK